MKYDFTSILDRQGKDALAVDVTPIVNGKTNLQIREGFSKIPMWVADMNFPAPPCILNAMSERISHPTFGYFMPPETYYQGIMDWQKSRNGVEGLKKEHIGYENGVLGGVMSALNALCSQGDAVLLHSPAYIGFTNLLDLAGYKAVLSPLKRDEDGIWRMDYGDMDAKIKEHKIHAAILCSPHNPCGRVWERWELEKAMEVYKANDVYVISDEIWSDIILSGNKHIPTQSVSQDARMRTAAFYSISKTFSTAGLVGSYHIIYNSWLRDRIDKVSALSKYNHMNVLSMHAQIGAYSQEGQEWVDELCQVLTENVDYAYRYICEHFEGVTLQKPQGTYMLFLDCEEWCRKHGKTLDELLEAGMSVGVIWQDGRPFFGACAIRMNLALPLSRVKEAFERLDRYVFHAE